MAHVVATKLDAAEETHHYEFQRTLPRRLTRKTISRGGAEAAEARRNPELEPGIPKQF